MKKQLKIHSVTYHEIRSGSADEEKDEDAAVGRGAPAAAVIEEEGELTEMKLDMFEHQSSDVEKTEVPFLLAL